MPHKIYINGRFLTQKITGVQRYAWNLIAALDKILETQESTLEFQVLVPPGEYTRANWKQFPIKQVGKLKGHLWEQLELPWFSQGALSINLCNTAPLFGKTIVTIHDAAVFAKPEGFSRAFKAWYQFLLPQLGKHARLVITNSQFSKNELHSHAQIPMDKMHVIYLGSEQLNTIKANSEVLNKWSLSAKKYLLAVSSLHPNKNHQSLVRALGFLPNLGMDIVIVGGQHSTSASFVPEKANKVHYLGYVTDEDLKALYENAFCFVYPSLYEGFGLTPLEAMQCGCPVIVSDAASLPEVCGEAAFYCNAREPKAIAEAILSLVGDEELCLDLKHKGLEQAKTFRWDKAACTVLSLLEEKV